MARLKTMYDEKICPALQKKLDMKTIMQVPRLEKIVLNVGVGEAITDKKVLESVVAEITKISGQKPVITKARKSIAGFKIREDYPIGCMVTLRNAMMYEFLDRLISVALPGVRDFRGLSPKSFDGRGNYNFGVKEQIIFPEISYETVSAIRGLNITIVTNSETDEHAKELLLAFGLPIIS
jgi:large subunit ribosomal protein L5